MASLLESYESQYSSLTAEITSMIGRLSKFSLAERQRESQDLEKLFDEANELLEQMDLEVKEQPSDERQKYQTRLKSYKAELDKLQKDMKRAKLGLDERDELFGDADYDVEDQRTRLLNDNETLERTSRRLEHGYKTVLETEQIGTEMMTNLHEQRQTITRSRQRLQEMNTSLGKSSRTLSAMVRRIIQNRLLLIGLGLIFLVVIGVTIYFTVRRHYT